METNQDLFEVCVSPLSKPFYMENVNTHKAIFFILGIIFSFSGIIILTAPKAFVYGIVFIALGIAGIVSSVILIIHCMMQTGNCPYCKKELMMKYREKQFLCPLCNRPISKTKNTIENAEPLFLPNYNEPNISIEEMRDNFFNAWKLELQCDSEQRQRLERARTDAIYRLFEINPDNGTALCYSSNYELTGEVYEVTYKHCTCPDYKKRFRPCKHIYALNVTLGIIDVDEDLSGVPVFIKEKVDLLPPKSAARFKNILLERKFKAFGSFLFKNTSLNKPLLDVGLLVKTDETEKLLSVIYTRNDLVAQIYENKLDYKPKSDDTKESIINYIVNNEPKFAKKILKNNLMVSFSKEILDNYLAVYNFYTADT